ncbi:hypothetical protein CSUI_007125 [Cystoisospora suis]|uniref:Transmembrane protein n=1 Tax=Cystoisospora suis TaxID=483139 RepID=A0A2C6KEW4_9APIC|nr:hypothetical protein CSUI_007125 [Cystoisospora suis]
MAGISGKASVLWFCLLSAGFPLASFGAPPQQHFWSPSSPSASTPGEFVPQVRPAVAPAIPSDDAKIIAGGGQLPSDPSSHVSALGPHGDTGSAKDVAEACHGVEVATTKMSSAPLAILYYFNPDSVIHFHSLSLLLPDGKTFLADVRAVVRDPPPTDENPFPKSVAHLSGGYKLTLSLEGVKLEDHEDNEIASWEAETVLHPIILEEVSIRDAAAIAPASSGTAAVSSVAATSAVPGGIPDSSVFQQGSAGGSSPTDNTQKGPVAVVAGGRAMKSVRVLAVSRGNLGSVRISTNRNISAASRSQTPCEGVISNFVASFETRFVAVSV